MPWYLWLLIVHFAIGSALCLINWLIDWRKNGADATEVLITLLGWGPLLFLAGIIWIGGLFEEMER